MQPNILLVDDRPENLLALEAILDSLDAQLVRANSGQEALKHLLRDDFAVILLDVQMPGLDGFETAALIKERDRTSHIPIIFITAISKEQMYVEKGYTTGAVDYISKPFNPDILRAKVTVFLDLFRKTQQLQEQSARLLQAEHETQLRAIAERERDAERQHAVALAQSQRALQRFKDTLDATLDGVFIFEARTLKFFYTNRGASAQSGYDGEELLTKTPLDLLPECLADETLYRDFVAPMMTGEVPSRTLKTHLRRRDGAMMPVDVLLQYVAPAEYSGESDNAPKRADGSFIAIARDITEQQRMEQTLIEAKEDAERANAAKSEFISSVSHELRTPLNAILGFSKLLLNPRIGEMNEDQSEYTRDIVQSAEHLLQLINDILDLSKIEAGKLTLHATRFPLVELLDSSLIIVREKAQHHSIELLTEYSEEARELIVAADQRKVKQILFNLLSNAVKFTPDGGRVTLGAALSQSGEEVVIYVNDTGVGIAPENQARIFSAFEQVDSSYTRQREGTGLGLALTHRLVTLHGGRIWLESEVNVGSTFSFSLPLGAALSALHQEDGDAPDNAASPDNAA